MKDKIKVTSAMLTAMIFWGISFIWSEQALAVYTPFTLLLFRLSLSTLLLFTINIWLKKITRIRKEDILLFALLAFMQPFAYFIGENYGIIYTDSTTTSVVIATIPLFSPVAAYFFLKEKLSIINFIGILISIIGVLFVILKEDLSVNADIKGLLMLFGAVICAVIYSVIIVRLSDKYNIYTILAYQNIFGIIWFIPVFLIFDLNSFILVGFNKDAFIPILLLAVFGSTVCYLFFIYGVKKLGVTRANIYGNSIPVFTAVFAFLILNKDFSLINIIGIFLVLSGVTVTQLNTLKIRKASNAVLNKIKIRRIYPKS